MKEKMGTTMRTSLRGIANKAANDKQHRFGGLYRMLNEENLRECFYQLRKDAASGIDGVTFQEYEEDLDHNLEDLVERLKAKRYRAKLVKRKLIPKAGSSKKRPLGIPALEDKLLQRAVADILSAIFEQDFLPISYGYRKGKGAHGALDLTREIIWEEDINCVVEADIRGFFDNIDHHWMVEMLEERISDRSLIRLIRKWLRAGILEEWGEVVHPRTGTPQGGLVSPVLANIYLHYVLDLWFERKVKASCEGYCEVVRYADDFVCLFQSQEEGERFYIELGARMEKFGLELSEEKSGVKPFSSWRELDDTESFELLGFEFRRTINWKGNRVLERRTSPKRMRASVTGFSEWIRANRHLPKRELEASLRRKLQGYWNYYAISGNSRACNQVYEQWDKLLFKWLNRRSDRRSMRWDQYARYKKRIGIKRPRVRQGRPVQLEFELTVGVV